LYTSEKNGNDATGDGSSEKPFKTILQAMRHAGKEPFPTIYVDGKVEGEVTDSVDPTRNNFRYSKLLTRVQ